MPLTRAKCGFLLSRFWTSSARVCSPSPRTIVSIVGYSSRLCWVVAVKCCPPVIVCMFGSVFLAVSRVRATTYVLHVASELEAKISGLEDAIFLSRSFQSRCRALQSTTSISVFLTSLSRYAASWIIPYGGGK